jgi:hypothetical protein
MERRQELKKGILALLVLAFSLAIVLPAFAEDPAQEAKGVTKPPVKTELVRLKYYAGLRMMALINTYLSRDGRVSPGPDEKILVISDYPENIEKILQAIGQIDVKPPDLLFTVQLILGTGVVEKGGDALPNDPIIKELRNLLKYKSYSLLDTSLVRAMDNSDSQVRMGEKAEFEFWIRPKVIKDEKASLIQMEVRLRRIFIASMPPNATSAKPEYITTDLIGTTLNIKPGDKTVVGVSKLDGSGTGLILIISGKIVD